MVPSFEERFEQFRRREAERAHRAGLSAYILNEDGSVLRMSPDGKNELIAVVFGRRRVEPLALAKPRP